MSASTESEIKKVAPPLPVTGLEHLAVLTAMTDGVVVSDADGIIIWANPAVSEILADQDDALAGRPIEALFAPFEPEGRQEILVHLNTLHALLKQAYSGPVEMREVILESKNQAVSARITVTSDAPNRAIVTVLRDITQEVQADRAKSEFVSMVSHELRTPMTSIKGYTALLQQGAVGPLDEKQRHFVGIVQRNVDRLASLINDLLDVSRIEAGKIRLNIKEINLADLARQVVETLKIPAQDKNLNLNLQISENSPPVQADWDRITQVLTNLIGNAIAYTQQGSVTISLQGVANAIQVSVRDTGIGIDPQDLNHIFEPFYRADNETVLSTGGTGLGLPIVKSIVAMHGGRIWVESKPNHGSTFTFILPQKDN